MPRSGKSALIPHLTGAGADPFVGRQFIETHGAARADFIGADADFRTHAELSAVRKTRGRVPIHRGGIHFVQELFRMCFVPRDDAV